MQQRATLVKQVFSCLVVAVLTFCLVDLYYLVAVTKHHKLQDIRPAFQQQKDKVQQVWRKEKQEIKQLLGNKAGGSAASTGAGASGSTSAAEQQDPHSDHPNAVVANAADDEEVDNDKEEIYEILEQAGVKRHEIDIETRRKLPTWSQVQSLYGTEPKIYGLDRCEAFTSSIEPSVSFFGTAGTFNSGTNLLAEMLIQNCQITKRMQVYGDDSKGMRWQVPWGKHTPVQYREDHVTDTDKDVPLQNSIPMITIRDPYRWMRSMCKHIYGARWPHNKTSCPNVYLDEESRPSPVRVKYKQTIIQHKSLPGMWNDWYNAYLDVDFPRVIVRFEDLLFYGKNVTQTLCKCGGGSPRRRQFAHVKSSAKLGTAAHGANKTNLLDALIQFGNDRTRLDGMTKTDLKWSHTLLDDNLMNFFDYRYATNY
jgi:hypothetical protein